MNRIRKASIGAAMLLATAGTTAQAATCWSGVQQAAAKVRNLQLRLMDATLRCQVGGIDITAAYNAFVNVNRATLQGANTVLRERMGESEYDRFVTSLANGPAAPTSADSCAQAAAAATEGVAAAGEVQTLLAVEERFGLAAEPPGETCPINFAMASTVAAQAATPAPAAVEPAAVAVGQ